MVDTPNDESKAVPFVETVMLRNTSGMIRDCFWDGDYLVIRQIMADPQNGSDNMRIKAFRLSKEEWITVSTVLNSKIKGY